jgi:CIC family chloride channel protein
MGGVFAGAAQAPLTAIASVAEMTGNFTLTLPIMLATGIAAALSKRLSYGSIYTTKLLRRGIDIERPRATNVLQLLTVADVMQPLSGLDGRAHLVVAAGPKRKRATGEERWEQLLGPVTDRRQPQVLFAEEDLEQALRQLVLFGRDGLPVLSHDGERLLGWITRDNVLAALAERLTASTQEIERGAVAAGFAVEDPNEQVHVPSTPLRGYQLVELSIGPRSPALDRRLDQVPWPAASLPVAVTKGREILAARPDIELVAGERVIVLVADGAPKECQA